MVSLSSRHAFLSGRQHTKTPTHNNTRRVARSSFRDRLLIPLPEHRRALKNVLTAGPEGVLVDEDLIRFSKWLRDDNDDHGG